ncbi:DUF1129 family protein [Geobacillus sp. G4]|uniref:DUF1129 family protein n=1 Tax=Geobacillus sp. G4 TaxID=3169691 RepID=UPI00333B9167
MKATDLIALNNEKRKLLNSHNRVYYENMLVYIRSHLMISQQSQEELLMELLDHLIEAQKQGKQAEEVFGKDAKSYCDELIRQMPKEKGKYTFGFLLYLSMRYIAFVFFVTGVAELVAKYVLHRSDEIFLGKEVVNILLGFLLVLFGVALVMHFVRNSVFPASPEWKRKRWRVFFAVVSILMLVIGGGVATAKFVPPFGVRIEAGWVIHLLFSCLAFAVSWLMNQRCHWAK